MSKLIYVLPRKLAHSQEYSEKIIYSDLKRASYDAILHQYAQDDDVFVLAVHYLAQCEKFTEIEIIGGEKSAWDALVWQYSAEEDQREIRMTRNAGAYNGKWSDEEIDTLVAYFERKTGKPTTWTKSLPDTSNSTVCVANACQLDVVTVLSQRAEGRTIITEDTYVKRYEKPQLMYGKGGYFIEDEINRDFEINLLEVEA
jgi:hypothetical protein